MNQGAIPQEWLCQRGARTFDAREIRVGRARLIGFRSTDLLVTGSRAVAPEGGIVPSDGLGRGLSSGSRTAKIVAGAILAFSIG